MVWKFPCFKEKFSVFIFISLKVNGCFTDSHKLTGSKLTFLPKTATEQYETLIYCCWNYRLCSDYGSQYREYSGNWKFTYHMTQQFHSWEYIQRNWHIRMRKQSATLYLLQHNQELKKYRNNLHAYFEAGLDKETVIHLLYGILLRH